MGASEARRWGSLPRVPPPLCPRASPAAAVPARRHQVGLDPSGRPCRPRPSAGVPRAGAGWGGGCRNRSRGGGPAARASGASGRALLGSSGSSPDTGRAMQCKPVRCRCAPVRLENSREPGRQRRRGRGERGAGRAGGERGPRRPLLRSYTRTPLGPARPLLGVYSEEDPSEEMA